jgi:single-strand DNA-binding protein
MAKTQNSVQLIGYLGKDPVHKTAVNGSKLIRLRLVTDDFYRKNENGSVNKRTSWHDIVVWDRLAERLTECFTTGSHILVEGQLKYRSYLNKAGLKCNTAEIRATKIIDLDR